MKKLHVLLLIFLIFSPVISQAQDGKSLYNIIGVSETASPQEIEQALKRFKNKSYHEMLGLPQITKPNKVNEAYNKMLQTLNILSYHKPEDQKLAREILQTLKIKKDETLKKKRFGEEIVNKFSRGNYEQFSKAFSDHNIFSRHQGPNIDFLPAKKSFNTILRYYSNFKQSQNKKDLKMAEKALKNLLEELLQTHTNKKTLRKILESFYNEFVISSKKDFSTENFNNSKRQSFNIFIRKMIKDHNLYTRTPGERKALKLFRQFSFFNQDKVQYFINEGRRVELLEKIENKEKLNSLEMEEFKKLEKANRKDIKIFRQILSALGLPSQTHADFLIEAYMDNLKENFRINLQSGSILEEIDLETENLKKEKARAEAEVKVAEKTREVEVAKKIAEEKARLGVELAEKIRKSNSGKISSESSILETILEIEDAKEAAKKAFEEKVRAEAELAEKTREANLGKISSIKGVNLFEINEKEALLTLRNMKAHFDTVHFETLRDMSKIFNFKRKNSTNNQTQQGNNPLNSSFLKNFPLQLVIFHAALGASIYRQAKTDSLLYGTETNPGEIGDALGQSLTPAGILSFFVFVAASQKINYRFYQLGRFMDGKSLGSVPLTGKVSRAIAPSLGLGLGFFISSLFGEVLSDKNLQQCTKQFFKKTEQEDQAYQSSLTACDKFYIQWKSSEKWKHYAVDMATMIGSSLLSHQIITMITSALRSTHAGARFLIVAQKVIPLRYAGWIGFFFNMWAFLEVHKALDYYVGQPLKKQWTQGGIERDLINLTDHSDRNLQELKSLHSIFNSQTNIETLNRLREEKREDLKDSILDIGHKFQYWTSVQNTYYAQSTKLWSQQLSNLTSPYEGASEFLKNLFISSQLQYDRPLNEYHLKNWNSLSHQETEHCSQMTEDMASWDSLCSSQADIETLQQWSFLNSSWDFDPSLFFDPEKPHQESLKNTYCPIVTENTPTWKSFCSPEEEEIFDYNALVRDTYYLIKLLLDKHPSDKESTDKSETINESNFINYVGKNLNEMFSSDVRYSIQNLSFQQQLKLATTLITEGLAMENVLSHFLPNETSMLKRDYCKHFYPNHTTDKQESEYYQSCLDTLNTPEWEVQASCAFVLGVGYGASEEDLENLTEEEKDDIHYHTSICSLNQDIKFKISDKLLTTGVYILKHLNNESKRPSFPLSTYNKEMQLLKSVETLTNLFTVYKKGEKAFILPKTQLQILKEALKSELAASSEIEEQNKFFHLSNNPYKIARGLLCGGKDTGSLKGLISSLNKSLFVIPQIFPSSQVSIYNFHKGRFEKVSEVCDIYNSYNENTADYYDSKFHRVLFDRPVEMNGQNYENLYIALETFLRNKYSSEKDIAQHFYQLSQAQLHNIGDQMSEELQTLTQDYYQEMINFDNTLNKNSSAEEFADYYNPNKISLREIGFKGLETSLFQVNYWIEKLKELLILGDQTYEEEKELNLDMFCTFNEQSEQICTRFDKTALEKAQKEVLSLFQSYHNSYKKEEEPYLLFPEKKFIDELTQVFKNGGRKELADIFGHSSRFTILKQKYAHSQLPVYMEMDMVLSHILEHSIPNWNTPAEIDAIQNGNTVSKGRAWEYLIYTVLSELNKSLNNFASQIISLQMQESFDKQREDLKSSVQ